MTGKYPEFPKGQQWKPFNVPMQQRTMLYCTPIGGVPQLLSHVVTMSSVGDYKQLFQHTLHKQTYPQKRHSARLPLHLIFSIHLRGENPFEIPKENLYVLWLGQQLSFILSEYCWWWPQLIGTTWPEKCTASTYIDRVLATKRLSNSDAKKDEKQNQIYIFKTLRLLKNSLENKNVSIFKKRGKTKPEGSGWCIVDSDLYKVMKFQLPKL